MKVRACIQLIIGSTNAIYVHAYLSNVSAGVGPSSQQNYPPPSSKTEKTCNEREQRWLRCTVLGCAS